MSTWSHEQINSRLDVLTARVRAAWDGNSGGPIFLTMVVSLATVVALVALTNFAIESHADGYRAAGVPAGQAAAGAIVAQVFVAAATVTAVLLFRAGRTAAVRILAVVAVGLLLLFVILPNVVGGSSWLTTFLAVLTALLLHMLVGVVAGVVALLSGRPQTSTVVFADGDSKEAPRGNR